MTAESLTAWRKRLGLNKLRAAIALGIGRNTIDRYERGEYPIPLTVALACAALASPAHGVEAPELCRYRG